MKNNEIKVIECNLRAARSFRFVSKITAIDAIEMVTEVMMGRHVASYPESGMPSDYVGVKVPQFSFSRRPGAVPVLGIEMASTGEVACFGEDKYETYVKALMSTCISPPHKNILFLIGGLVVTRRSLSCFLPFRICMQLDKTSSPLRVLLIS